MTDHPITPPPELMHQWHKEACKDPYHGGTFFESKTLKHISTQAAQWGADQELEACCEWLRCQNLVTHCALIPSLRAARRPKPPSLKEQALDQLKSLEVAFLITHGGDAKTESIRRALEQLDD